VKQVRILCTYCRKAKALDQPCGCEGEIATQERTQVVARPLKANAFDQYQQEVKRTWVSGQGELHRKGHSPAEIAKHGVSEGIAIATLGLAGETGEVADLVKKWLGHGHALERTKLLLELGDVLWYLGALTAMLDVDLSEIARLNVQKLRERYPQGFDVERSKAKER
jgi:NTP pyrophosphatase (non-canonical NTP hydrolase)